MARYAWTSAPWAALALCWLPCQDGAPAQDVIDAANLGESGVAIVLLSYLFLGGPAPPPYAATGVDPTTDTLDCVGF